MNEVLTPDKSFGLNFFVDKERDKEVLFDWGWDRDPAGLESRADEKGISVEFACRLRDASNYEDVKEEIDDYIDGLYEDKAEQLQSFIEDLQDFWSKNLGLLTEVVKELTERSFYYPEYQVLVSACHMGMVSGGLSNDIGVGVNLRTDWRNRILAHELVEDHWRTLFREERLTEKLDNWRCWAFSEIGAVLVLKDERLKSMWSDLQQELDRTGYFARSNYPQLALVEAEIREVFATRKGLEDFLERASTVLMKYSDLQTPVAKPLS